MSWLITIFSNLEWGANGRANARHRRSRSLRTNQSPSSSTHSLLVLRGTGCPRGNTLPHALQFTRVNTRSKLKYKRKMQCDIVWPLIMTLRYVIVWKCDAWAKEKKCYGFSYLPLVFALCVMAHGCTLNTLVVLLQVVYVYMTQKLMHQEYNILDYGDQIYTCACKHSPFSADHCSICSQTS